MPILGKKQGERVNNRENIRPPRYSLPPPPDDPPGGGFHPLASHPIPPRNELLFHCQLAHGSTTRDIKNFSNVKELYTRIGEAFEIDPSNIIYCTLNTHKIDMSRLLGGQIGLDDFIFAHVRGNSKSVTITKQEVSIGLTITDNGAGSAFIKRIKSGSIASELHSISVGDMIESIDDRSLIGTKHYEVAKILKELPRYHTFTMSLIEPLKPFAVAPRNTTSKSGRPLSQLLGNGSTEEPTGTLRLKKDGKAVIEENVSPRLLKVIERIDDQLESFMGIRDSALSRQMVDLSEGKKSFDEFATVMAEGTLKDFQFPDDFIRDVWIEIHKP